jgi:Transposase IS4
MDFPIAWVSWPQRNGKNRGKNWSKMDEEEFASNEVWFGNQFRLTESQELEFIGDTSPVDDLVEADVAGEAMGDVDIMALEDPLLKVPTELPTELPTDIPTESQETMKAPEAPGEEEEDPELSLKPKAKRNTISYAKKMILAGLDIFLDPLYGENFTDSDFKILGQIKECPRASNGKLYRIEWKEPLPPCINRLWLRTHLVGSMENRALLKAAIDSYDGRRSEVVAKNQREPKKRKTASFAPVQQGPLEHIEAMAASASVRTSSTMSSLSQSTVASPPPHVPLAVSRTRSSLTLESDSDDGDDLDEEDNIYDESDLVNRRNEDDSDSDSDASTSTASSVGGLGQFLNEVKWEFTCDTNTEDEDAPFPYSGPCGLKPRVSESFSDPFECLAVCGGLDYDLVSRLARNSNEYAHRYLLPKDRNNRLQGTAFTNISTEEMYHFLGITLRISQSPIDSRGYEAYFSAGNKVILGLEIPKSDGFARHYMSLVRYKQIRSAFHPEDRTSGDSGDKCYQLRHAINTINQAAKNAKFIGENVTFDEGGIGSRHRLNPVRQYNKDKPQKFRVDFFIMACSKTYFIHHMDVYQGKNASNVGVDRSIRSLPTTMKAVLNAVLSTGMHLETHGARHIALDNRYQCPELAYLLRQKFKIISTGTCRQNRKGWNKSLMNLGKTKSEDRGKYKFSVEKNNKVICYQWVDSRVVNVVSSFLSTEITKIYRQVGSKKSAFSCPVIVTKYQKNMLGVDKSDQMRAAGGAFAAKAHYQKWYK